jgi:hypothetical protein
MGSNKNTARTVEFGDYQTPLGLAERVCALLAREGLEPAAIVEPTCGEGAFLVAALERFPAVQKALGLEINPVYVARAQSAIKERGYANRVEVRSSDFFLIDWRSLLAALPEPLLVVGNPPWVTNAELGILGSRNLPSKSNFQNRRGLDAVTGKSNFDISEWMLIKLLDSLNGRRATLAMLCKTGVARKVLLHAWKTGLGVADAEIRLIDAERSFGAAAEACLLVCQLSPTRHDSECRMYSALADTETTGIIGYRDNQLVADLDAYARSQHLRGRSSYRWRSGVKHDCSKVMELRAEGGRYRNGLGELVSIEDLYLYPMLKGSEVAAGALGSPKRWMLVTQTHVGEDTSVIRVTAPKTWEYLVAHSQRLDRRASSIYRSRPRFAVFGVGDYSFAPWKIAVSALHKKLQFSVIGKFREKPILLDDTCYFLPCQHEEQARLIQRLLNVEQARHLFAALIFWDAKRPITVDILDQLDLRKLAAELGMEKALSRFAVSCSAPRMLGADQLGLFESP